MKRFFAPPKYWFDKNDPFQGNRGFDQVLMREVAQVPEEISASILVQLGNASGFYH